jgi:hypothetical protein
VDKRAFWIPAAMVATGIGILIFWIVFATVGLAPAKPPLCYFAYEMAFPPVDIALALVLIASGIGLIRAKPAARTWALAAAGAIAFLGGLDITFNAQNGIYTASVLDGVSTLAMNLWCVGLGTAVFRHLSGLDKAAAVKA